MTVRASFLKPFVLLAVAAFALAACVADDTSEARDEGSASAENVLACLATDPAGVNDGGLNQATLDGLRRAKDVFGGEVILRESSEQDALPTHIDVLIEEGCAVIMSAGIVLADVLEQSALSHPDRVFGAVDYFYENDVENLAGITFAVDEPAFLAGYLAAGMTSTGVIGTWGAVNIPPITIFMDGYLAGMNAYNDTHGTSVDRVGWDGTDGIFVGVSDSFERAYQVTADLLTVGADIIMPVGIPGDTQTASGIGAALDDFGLGALIWTGTDGYVSTGMQSYMLTSVVKQADNATFDLVRDVVEGSFAGGVRVGSLANDQVGLAPFHQFDAFIPDSLKAELDELRADIAAGVRTTSSSCERTRTCVS